MQECRVRALQHRRCLRVDELRSGEVLIRIVAADRMPLALHALDQKAVAKMVLWGSHRVVLHPDVIEASWARLEADPDDVALVIEQARGLEPEDPRLEDVAVPPRDNRLRHLRVP